MFGFLVVAIIFLLFRWLVPFLFTVFIEAFLLDLTAHFFRRDHYSTVFYCDCKTSREFNGLLLVFSVSHIKIKLKLFNRLSPESGKRKKVNVQRLSPRFKSQEFFLSEICGEMFYPNL